MAKTVYLYEHKTEAKEGGKSSFTENGFGDPVEAFKPILKILRDPEKSEVRWQFEFGSRPGNTMIIKGEGPMRIHDSDLFMAEGIETMTIRQIFVRE